jgi:hypothetical protein
MSLQAVYETLSREDVIQTTVVTCGVIDGIPFTAATLERPFFTLLMAVQNGASWWFSVRVMR